MIVQKNIVILGAGGFGREVHAWLLDWIARGDGQQTQTHCWKVAGFIDDNASAMDAFANMPPVLSSIEDFVSVPNTFVVCAIANPKVKKKVVGRMLDKGAQFLSMVHPTVVMGTNVRLGRGTVVCPLSMLSADISIGEFVTINATCTVGHDAKISRFCTLSGHCDVTGGVVLEEGVFMGSHAAVVPNVTVGEYAVIGASSLVVRKVQPGTTVFGVPAKRISR
ncbi:acetyltransferase [Pseudomonas sp. S5F11]|jgi:sugar O-acyltransferase (sialic acid O-acetyltransferase NeuD family)|uniref:acetyltransferase n=1 Tax=Pseudomonas sp. S5F11 TaxID=2866385 RepID=UPI001C7CE3B9|nr:acetyltransferase [Pseudomonas sp. S5F11]MBX4135794.1 acetyltransferase [Pseudomonas sp. S5F11]